MSISKELYEQAYYFGNRLTPEQENDLDPKWGVLYAKNVVKRKLRGVRVNENIKYSEYADEYKKYATYKPAFDEAFDSVLSESKDEDTEDEGKELEGARIPAGNLMSSKSKLVRSLIDQLEDQFDCHPSMLNGAEDFDRVRDSGPEMKKVIVLQLGTPECCPHSADRLKNSLGDTEDGNEILNKLYLAGNEWF